jgi:hypothetical protein
LRLEMLKRTALACQLFVALAGIATPATAWDDWLPLPPEDLELTNSEVRPGSSAIILLKTDYRNDREGVRELFYRIKILNDEGRDYADIEIPYNKHSIKVSDIEARVVQPNGEVIEFAGAIFEKTLAKIRRQRRLAKTFTLPEIRPGSVIEYRYKLRLRPGWLFNSYWPFQEQLFIRETQVSFKPAKYKMRAFSRNFPTDTKMREGTGGLWSFTLHNLPPLLDEVLSPPPRQLQARLHAVYGLPGQDDPTTFWQEEVGEDWAKLAEKFMSRPRRLRSVIDALISPEDTPEQKLRKLYNAVQKIRNLSYEEYFTRQERWEENLGRRDWAGDVWELGHGYDWEIARLFTALCRAAGLDANVVFVSERDDHFFDSNLLDTDQLDGELTVVELAEGPRYFDAGTRFTPFGELGWENQGTAALRVVNKRAQLVTTPASTSQKNSLQRDITLELSPNGDAQADVVVQFRGQSALDLRNELFQVSDRQREHRFRSNVEDALPGAWITQTSWSGLEDPSLPVEFRYSVELPGFAQVLGSRLVVRPALIVAKSRLKPWKRENPVYTKYARSEVQTVKVIPPDAFELEFLPDPQNQTEAVGSYSLETSREGGAVLVRREFSVDGVIFQPGVQYFALKQHLDRVQAGDELRLVFQRP